MLGSSEVWRLYALMRRDGGRPGSYNSVFAIRACAEVKNVERLKSVHCETLRSGLNTQEHVAPALVKLFEEMQSKDTVTWSLMVIRLAQTGRSVYALETFRHMLETMAPPNEITISSALLACSQAGSLLHGRSLHGFAVRRGIKLDVEVVTALIDMYCKCGVVWSARKLFDRMPDRNIFSWSAIISGFGFYGLCSEALDLFNQLKEQHLQSNAVIFVSLLSACSHYGNLEEARRIFESMTRDFGIAPAEEHYSCMVDLLGRAGLLDEAAVLIQSMAVPPGAAVWGAFLSGCRLHRRIDLAEMAAEKLQLAEPDQPGAFLLLSDVYASVGMADMVEKARENMRRKKLKKTIGLSSVALI